MAFDIAALLNTWHQAGVFDYVLPFLLMFAVVYGILSQAKIFGENKGVHAIIALVIGLLALQVGLVQEFFREIFPRAGIALAVVIVMLILTALFVPLKDKDGKTNWPAYVLYGIGIVAFLAVVYNSFDTLSWIDNFWWEEWGYYVIGGLVLVGVIALVVLPNWKASEPNQPRVDAGQQPAAH